MFADLRERRVLVVGGGEVAERKTRLLLEAGARVEIVAPALGDSLLRRLSESPDRLTWIAPEFEESQLRDIALVIVATSDAAVNSEVAAAARARGVFANVVDDAARSGFIVPAIVDRSPLVIAVSSGGAAPVLARLVRERIEAMVDDSVGALAQLLERWRTRIKAAIPDVIRRRRFYESTLRGGVATDLRRGQTGAAARALAPAGAGGGPATGSVALVGAGPGDPGLLTLNALRALQDADVVLYDRLVSSEVRGLARRDATCIEVGKQGRGRSVPQDRIHELMLEHARQGRRVVRLKGGDPFIFGRGGEELEFLAAHGVPYEVVPGITAAVACGAYAGVPLTHREHAQSVRFVTAHDHGSFAEADWMALAAGRQTLCLYMGIADLASFAAQLVSHGRRADTPVAVVENGSRADQRVTLASLEQLGDLSARAALQSPAMVIVGEVAALAGTLAWFGEEPRRWDTLRRVA